MFGVNEYYTSWICDFLSKRVLRLGRESTVVEDGLPQGSCLSPVLFNVYTQCLHLLQDDKTSVFQFADDFILISHDKDFESAVANLRYKMGEFADAATELNLSFNVDKCKVMYVAQGNKRTVNINHKNCVVPQASKLKFLGRVINNSLAVRDHYTEVVGQSLSNSNLFKMLTTVRAGLHPEVALKFYRSFVRSKLEYCRTTTAQANKTTVKKITTFQNTFLRRSLGVPPSTPVPLLYAVAHELPPDERSWWLTAKEILKLKQTNEKLFSSIECNPGLKTSYNFVFQKFRNVFLNTKCSGPFVKHECLKIDFKSLPNTKNQVSVPEMKAIFAQKINCYKRNNFGILATDASVGQESVGCGIFDVLKETEHKFRIDFVASSTFGELWAILKAIDLAHGCSEENIAIFSDSLAACKILAKDNSNNYCADLLNRRIQDYKFQNVHIIWTPGHSGIKINEKADSIAKEAVETGLPLVVNLTVDEALRSIKRNIYSEWFQGFNEFSQNNPNLLAKLTDKVPSQPWFKGFKIDVSDIKMCNRIITGHTYDNEYLYKIKAVNTPLCGCGETDSYTHQIFDCNLLNELRSKYPLFNNYKDFETLFRLAFNHKSYTPIISLIAFIHDANITF